MRSIHRQNWSGRIRGWFEDRLRFRLKNLECKEPIAKGVGPRTLTQTPPMLQRFFQVGSSPMKPKLRRSPSPNMDVRLKVLVWTSQIQGTLPN